MADQAFHALQRLLHRVNGVAFHVQGLEIVAGFDAGVGLHQIQNGCGIFDRAFARNHLGLATCKEITTKLIACHKTGGRAAHGFQPFQLKGQMRGQFFARWAFIVRVSRQQQARFQEGEPRGHDQIIGGQFNAQAFGFLDEAEVLFSQFKDGNFAKVNFLGARKG